MPEAPAAPESLYALDGSVKSAVGVTTIPTFCEKVTFSELSIVIAVASALVEIPATPADIVVKLSVPEPSVVSA